MSQDKSQSRAKHDAPWSDIESDHIAGRTGGRRRPGDSVTLADIAELTAELFDFTLAELRQIQMVRPGARLQPGATYLDLRDPQGEAFTATADMSVEDDDWYVAEATIPRRLWVRLLALVDPGLP